MTANQLEDDPDRATEPREPATSPQILKLTDLRKAFGGVTALDGVTFDLNRGETHAIVGENGAGKSTLIKIIAGAYRPDSGLIEIENVVRRGLSPDEARDLGIAVVYQEFNLLPDLTIAENIFLGHQPGGRLGLIDVRTRNRLAAEILGRLGANLDPERTVGYLTVGEQQIVEIAKALAVNARVLILDEPSAVLPSDDVERLFSIVRALHREGTSVIYISHRLDEIFEIADRVTVLKDGKSVTTMPVKDTSRPELVRLMVGRNFSEQFPDRNPHLSDTILEVRGLAADGCTSDISFSLRKGEILGLAGLGGSGRTTVCRALVGLAHVDAGEILFEGQPAPRNPARAAGRGIVLVPEDRKAHGLVMGRSVAFNLSLPWIMDISRLKLLVDQARAQPLIQRAITSFHLRPAREDINVENLSGGNQQKVVLGKWMMTNPRVAVLDEPTRGVDVGAKAEIYQFIEQISEEGVGVIMASSELPELLGTCDRILVFYEGRLAGEFPRGEATEEAIMRCATGTE